MDELEFRDGDGLTIFYRRWLPTGPARRIVLIAHGMSEHSGRYARVAAKLVARANAVYAPDHRGHGRTSKSTGVGRTGPSGMDGVLADLARLAEIARTDVGALPVVLFGHSMGSMISLAFAERHGASLVGLALSGSPGADGAVAEMARGIRQAVDAGMGEQPAAALSTFNTAFEPARTPYDWLSRDPAEVDAYLADPYCGDAHPMTYGFLAELMEMAAPSLEPSAIAKIPAQLPILLLTGEADPASNGAANVRELERRMRGAGLSVESIYYPGARHEVLNETNREEVERDLLAWIDRIVPA
ncbi:MAG TPA: alpha/beta hydrolase [Myxococcota bacterium]|nr:alpha/beta hydrolase [Myxococcota bacterium]